MADRAGQAPSSVRELPAASARGATTREEELEQERKIVARAQAGDRDALGGLLRRYGPTLYRSVLLPRLGSQAHAQDALSETYAKVVRNIGQFTWHNVGFYPWLRTVALRVALDHLRARKRVLLFDEHDLEREIGPVDDVAPADERIIELRDREAARRKVDEALERISPRYARAIRARILEERSRDEVAAELGVSTATFDVVLHRAVAALKKALEERSHG